MRISYSAIEVFKKCPQKYKFKEIDRIKEPSSIDAMFGAAIHDALQYFHSQKQLPSLESLMEYFLEEWEERKEKMKEKNIPDFQWQLTGQEAKNILTNYYNDSKDKNCHVVALESKFEVPIEYNGDFHILTGKIDRIDRLEDGSFEIIDYKTSRQLPSQETINENLQLSIYHLGLIEKWPEFKSRDIKLTLYFLKHREKISSKKDDRNLTETKEKLIKTISEIQNSKFSPTASGLCDFCGYKNICPMWKHKTSTDEQDQIDISTTDIKSIISEFVDTKSQISDHEKRLDELKDIINSYCDQQGLEQVFNNDGISIMRQLQQRHEYDVDKIKTILEPLNKWHEVIAIDSKKLQTIQKSLPIHIRNALKDSKVFASEFKKFLVKKNKSQEQEEDSQ